MIQVINVQFDFGPGRSLNPEALQSIVDFVYSREILLNVDTVQVNTYNFECFFFISRIFFKQQLFLASMR